MTGTAPKITVIFLLYNAERTVEALVEAIGKQRHPAFHNQEEWLEVLFMDDQSRDDTAKKLQMALEKAGRPALYRALSNPVNLGLSRTLNKAFKLARSPYGLSCHCDVIFGRDDYVATMLELMESYPDAGAITGQPVLPTAAGRSMPLAEKVNVVTNLMDIFPPEPLMGTSHGPKDLVTIGFAEGRCDVFRIAALEAVGYYDTTLRLAGEDQVLAARLRSKGFEIYQAPSLPYFLSVSDEQDSLEKLLKHQMLYGRAHPYILLKVRQASVGVVGKIAGANRQARTLLRALQLVSSAVYLWTLFAILLGLPAGSWLAPLLSIFLAKHLLFLRHLKAVPLTMKEFLVLYGFQPLLDIAYSLGLLHGLWLVSSSSKSRPIS
ncbi:MAG: hypothetical protein A2428_17680 [Bdellovibrionales bacterium RIFOXYC1_FULL_54_43]|nr:MAG: hypothetical protein A2428_17680 [Bdellovibrionales bacterium RIFOXYC1_FULL_54_43]OFZ79194.1 MAG: hypothetical protein A2603_03995 [Bdellovibrionales bacterium RIFOXYD1_FULL_55_31]